MDEKLFSEILSDTLQGNISKINEIEKFFDYYRGDHDILKKKNSDIGKPNNKHVFNFAELIIDTNHSYLFSKKQSYDFKLRKETWIEKIFSKTNAETLTQEFLDDLGVLYFDNEEESITSKHGKISAITGESVELHYIDTEGNIKFAQTDPREWTFFTYDGEEYAVRNYKKEQYEAKGSSFEKVLKEFAEVYSKNNSQIWEKTDNGFEKTSQKDHFYGEIPVIRFFNRDKIEARDSISDLKNVVNLIDSFNSASSSIANTLEYMGNPYLLLKGFEMDQEQRDTFKETRIMELDEESSAEFLNWDHNTAAYDSMLTTIERMIFVLSFTPDLFSKEGLSSDSGVSLKMKFVGADLKADQKERSFINGFRKRLRLLSKQLENKTNKQYFSSKIYRNIDISFNRSTPQNLKEQVEIVKGLVGTVSEETRIKLLPFINNSKDEMDKIKKENDSFGDLQ